MALDHRGGVNVIDQKSCKHHRCKVSEQSPRCNIAPLKQMGLEKSPGGVGLVQIDASKSTQVMFALTSVYIISSRPSHHLPRRDHPLLGLVVQILRQRLPRS
jgi:hypothetical protein